MCITGVEIAHTLVLLFSVLSYLLGYWVGKTQP